MRFTDHLSSLIATPCEHGTADGADAKSHCSKCFGTGKRYVPAGMTAHEFDRLSDPLRYLGG